MEGKMIGVNAIVGCDGDFYCELSFSGKKMSGPRVLKDVKSLQGHWELHMCLMIDD